ncbi:lipopolysaccharide biosynthesis protein [Croceibacterium sp. TMG7-5b_MA50]|uniref:lipopolysaccharide biosynthesis protein n=1 Tax=Croceibacterium sp. TMG7-5b_MA50 TaxID=3121290 RepID=UPI003221681A
MTTLFWQMLRTGLQIGSLIVLSRLLGPREIGLMSMVVAITGIGGLLRDFGLSVGSVRLKNLSHEEKSNLFWVNGLLGSCIAAICFLLAVPIANFYDQPELVNITRILSVTFLISGLSTQLQAELQRNLRFSTMGAIELTAQAVGVAAAILVALQTPTVAALLTQAIVQSVTFFLFQLAKTQWWPSWPSRTTSIRHIVRFGAGLSGTQLLAYVSKNVDNVLIGMRFGAYELGVYSRAFQLVTTPLLQMMSPMSRVSLPVFARIVDDDQQFLRYLVAAQTVVIAGGALFFGCLAGTADVIIGILLGSAWLAAAPISQALAAGAVFKLLGQVPYWIFVAYGASGRQFKLYLVGQPIIIACIVGGLSFGSIGVAWGGTIGYGIFWAMQMWTAQSVARIDVRKLAVNGIMTAAVIGLPAAAITFSVLRFVIGGIPGLFLGPLLACLYTGLLIALMPERRRLLIQIVRQARG